MAVSLRAFAPGSNGELRNDGRTDAEFDASLFLLSQGIFDLLIDCLPAIDPLSLIGNGFLGAGDRLVMSVAVLVDVYLNPFHARFGFGQYSTGFKRVETLFESSDSIK